MIDDGRKVENQHHAPIAHNGCAADEVGRDRLAVQRFDNKFFFAIERVDDQAKLSFGNVDDEDEQLPRVEARFRDAAKAHQGQNFVAQRENFVMVNLMDLRLEVA